MTTNIINFPATEVADETADSPALIIAKEAISNLTDDEVDELFSYLWAMGYGDTGH
jgi:hypothetical protein